MANILFDRLPIPDLSAALNAYSARQKVISNNIANANTPGYKAKNISFEEEYNRHINSSKVSGKRTDSRHIPIGSGNLEDIRPIHTYRHNTLNDTGINNVDIDQEMAELAKNSLKYEMSTLLIHKRFQNLRSSIRGR